MTAAARRRLFVARFSHEGNAFGPLRADLAAFRRNEWHRGPGVVAGTAGTSQELSALQPFVQAHSDWELVVSRCASALPSGPIEDAVFDAFLQEVLADLEAALGAGGLHGIYLSLHGAAITPTRLHADLDLVEAVHARCPDLPLAVTFDLHGNLHPRLAESLAIGFGYRTHPHVDMREVATRAIEGLVRLVEDRRRTRCAVVQTRVLLSSLNMRTEAGPMRELQEAAAQAERQPGVLAASVFGGFPYADTPCTGASSFVFTDADADPDGTQARRVAEGLADCIRASSPAFDVRLPTAEEGLAQALAFAGPGLVAVADAADNPYSGGAADTPAVLRALLASSAVSA
ncbi:MAG TPA: M81 family metallopeptidase, partial [Ramlibacter sp.]|nr:M81 family metallopeptidase [Ramlibacter sp.]